jgi:hypothetical protein
MDRQDRADEVEPELAVQIMRPEETEVRPGGAHPYPVQAHEPRAGLSPVPQDPGVPRAVPLVGEPPFQARLSHPRLVAALEGEVFEAVLRVSAVPTAQLLDRWGVLMIEDGIPEPASLFEQG